MKLKIFLILPLLLIFTNITFGQGNIEIPLNNLSGEWTTFYEDSIIQLSSKESSCIDPAGGRTIDRLLIQIKNRTGNNVLVNWHYDIYNRNECLTCDDPNDENLFRYILSANQIIIPDCNSYKLSVEGSEDQETVGIYLKYSERTDDTDTQAVVLSDFSTYILN